MEKELGRVTFDYYENSPSYVKMVNDMLPENKISNEKKLIIKKVYNEYLNNLGEDKITDFIEVSRLFMEKLSITDVNSIALQLDYINNNFLNRIIFDTFNRELVFDIMNECMKLFVGYYDKVKTSFASESCVPMNNMYNTRRR